MNDSLFSEERSAEVVAASFGADADPRLRRVMTSLVRHLHDFVKDVELTNAEWEQAIAFLTATGQKCDSVRQEFILLSDVLGVSMLVETINHRTGGQATESTVTGPFHLVASPPRQLGADIALAGPGEPCLVTGQVTGPESEPLRGARMKVGQASADGFYDVKQPAVQPEGNLRGLFTAGSDGRFWFRTIVPSHYPIPGDGPVGDLLRATGRHPYRPAHIHFIVSAPGYRPVTTHLFVDESLYIDSDAVFGVKDSLVRRFPTVDDPARAAEGSRSDIRGRLGIKGRPIVQADVHDTALGLAGKIIHVAFQPVVVVAEDLGVAAILVEVERDQQEGAVPRRAVAPRVAPAAGGDNAGQFARRALLIAQVVDPLGINGGRGIVEQPLLSGEVGVARPAVLLAMRAIRRDALQVAQVRPAPGAPDSVEQRIRAFELTGNRNGRVDENAAQGVEGRLAGKPGDFDILEAMVVEAGVPGFQALAFRDKGIGLILLAGIHPDYVLLDVGPINDAILAQALAILHHHLGAREPAHAQLGEASEVLAHVEDKDARLRLGEFDRFDDPVRLDGRHHLRGQLSAGGWNHLGHGPLGIVVSRCVPAGLLLPSVIGLAAVDAIEGDRSGAGRPPTIGPDGFDAAIGVFHVQLHQQLGRGAPRGFVEVPHRPRLDIIPAVAEDYADGILPAAQGVGDIVGDVERAFVIAGVAWVEQVVADLLAVEVKLVITER